MKKLIFVAFAMVSLFILSGCGEHLPTVEVHNGYWKSYITIDVGKPYVYKDFDIEVTDGGEGFDIAFCGGRMMSGYHVGCGLAGIYAGTLNPKGDSWRSMSDVTNEAISAVVNYMYLQIPNGENCFAYGFKMRDGKYVRLKIEASDTCPEWAKELEGES